MLNNNSGQQQNQNIQDLTQKILYACIQPVRNGLVTTMRKLGKDIFDRSQQLVPVATGKLKRSGSYTVLQDGSRIAYDAPYAVGVESGQWQFIKITNANKSKFQRYMKNQFNVSPNKFKNLTTIKHQTKKPSQFLKLSLDEYLGDLNDPMAKYIKKYGQEEVNKIKIP